ncbi:MAG: guanylate kinase [candidate division KSB1 bacterium]|nr:guanylate kinase [candidate division KSB1 bacterium]MDZ7365737.1 guanylate kinase [candidate division KSB1 bacterium]MDZ7403783.1 guanylate kinase [candidate division KSB1 bacterium]
MQQPETSFGGRAKRGYLVVISAPSGGGKTTVIRRLLENRQPDFAYSVSATTRAPRSNEQHGRDYYFLSDEEFATRIREGGFIEWATVHGNLYGTPKEPVENWLAAGLFVFMDLDVQGGINVKTQYGDRAILIFIKPPSMELLRNRLTVRNTDSPEAIKTRLQNAEAELEKAKFYDHIVVNHQLDDTVAEVRAIINQYRQ